MKSVVLDANALLMPFQRGLNIDTELARILGSYELIIPRPIIGELERNKSKEAKMGLALARTKHIEASEKEGDMSVLDVAERFEGIILTNDRDLIEIARGRNIPVIRLVGGNRLGFDSNKEY